MTERPTYCDIAKCPNFGLICRLNEIVKRMYPSYHGKKEERRRLNELAEKDPAKIIKRCSTGETTVVFRR